LVADEEAKIVAARHFLDLGLVAEWHFGGDALLDAVLNEWPCEGFAFLGAGEGQIAASSDVVDLYVAFGKDFDFLWSEHILIVSQSELTSLIATPAHELTRLLDQQHAPVLHSYRLLDSHATLILDLDLLFIIENMINRHIRISNAALVYDDLVDV